MTEDEAEKIAKATVKEMFLRFGVDLDEPGEATAVKRDFAFMRSWRTSTEVVKQQGLITAVGVIVAGFLGWLFYAFTIRP